MKEIPLEEVEKEIEIAKIKYEQEKIEVFENAFVCIKDVLDKLITKKEVFEIFEILWLEIPFVEWNNRKFLIEEINKNIKRN